jgi:ferredoxin--NADP+ reductase
MNEILLKRILADKIKEFEIYSPLIARKRKAGQFIILRIDEKGERIPLTIADSDPEKGTVTIIFQEVGKSTMHLGMLKVGDRLRDFVGPLGNPTHIEQVGTVCCIGGGCGTAPVYPIAKAHRQAGNRVVSIVGARSKDLIIMEDRMRAISHELHICTDDGTYGFHGFVSDMLKRLLEEGKKIDLVIAVGPVPMMKAVANLTKGYDLTTIVSLNTIMVDGTGMCGACRVTVGGVTRFVCVDGPEFDGHLVDWGEMTQRMRAYLPQEKESLVLFQKEHPAEGLAEACGYGR